MRTVRSGAAAAAVALTALLAVAAPVAAACPGMGGPAQTQSTAGTSAGASTPPVAMAVATPVAAAAAAPAASPMAPQPPAATRASWETRAATVLGRVGHVLLASLRSALTVFAHTMASATPLRPV